MARAKSTSTGSAQSTADELRNNMDAALTPVMSPLIANLRRSRTLATLLPKLLSGELSVAAASATMEASV